MTVIATDGKSMAGDGMCCLHDRIIDMQAVKVRKLSDGAIFGASGECADADKLARWIESGRPQGEKPKLIDINALVLNPDGSVDLYEDQNEGASTRERAPIAVGSGMESAMAAMDAGASPEDAVAIAIGRITTCGGRITSLSLE